MNIERRNNIGSPVRLEKREEGKPPVITGTAAVFYDPADAGTEYVLWEYAGERCVERVLPGAFDKVLARPDDVRGLFNHEPDNLLARTASGTMKLTVTAKGLEYEITPGNTTVAKDVMEHLERKDVTGSSYAFCVDEERWTETKGENGACNVLREIISVTAYDVGPVVYPAFESTTAGMRKAGEIDEAKRSLAAFREQRGTTTGGGDPLKAKLAGIAARARACEVAA